MTDFDPGNVSIAMTDLFLSATAALLIVLAVLRPTPPVTLPIQADLVARCTLETNGVEVFDPRQTDRPAILIDRTRALSSVPERLGLAPKLFYTIALSDPQGVSADCAQTVLNGYVRAHNEAVQSLNPGTKASRAIFTLAYDQEGLSQ
jgi:hypothetical protein